MSDNVHVSEQQRPTFDLLDDELVKRYAPPQAIASCAHIGSFEKYMAMYEQSLKDPAAFWYARPQFNPEFSTYWRVGAPSPTIYTSNRAQMRLA